VVVGRLLGVDTVQRFVVEEVNTSSCLVVNLVVDSSLVVIVLLSDLVINGVGVAAEVENVVDVSIFDDDTGDCVTADDGVDPKNIDHFLDKLFLFQFLLLIY
jgi:hypothetical protein